MGISIFLNFIQFLIGYFQSKFDGLSLEVSRFDIVIVGKFFQ